MRLKPAFDWTSEQELYHSLVVSSHQAFQPVFTAVEPFELKLLAGQNVVQPTDIDRQLDLAIFGNNHRHARHAMAFLTVCQI